MMEDFEEELQLIVKEEQEEAKRSLAPLVLLLAALLTLRGTPDEPPELEEDLAVLTAEISAQVASSFYRAFERAARAQADMLGAMPETASAASTAANAYADMAMGRMLDVLDKGKSEAELEAYLNLVAEQAVNTATRDGAEVAARLSGATMKRLARLQDREQPRQHHDELIGLELGIDEEFELAGVMVLNFGDENLPIEEIIHCGHGAIYF